MLAQASSKRLAMGWPGVQPAVVSIAGEGVAQNIKFEDEGPHDSQRSPNLSDPRHRPGHCYPPGMWRPKF